MSVVVVGREEVVVGMVAGRVGVGIIEAMEVDVDDDAEVGFAMDEEAAVGTDTADDTEVGFAIDEKAAVETDTADDTEVGSADELDEEAPTCANIPPVLDAAADEAAETTDVKKGLTEMAVGTE